MRFLKAIRSQGDGRTRHFGPRRPKPPAEGERRRFGSLVAMTIATSLPALTLAPPASANSFGTWQRVHPTNEPRVGHAAVLLNDGTVLIAGSFMTGLAQEGRTAEIYDPGAQRFRPTASMAYLRAYFSLLPLPDGRVIAPGGYQAYSTMATTTSTEIFDPASRTWSLGPKMHERRDNYGAVILPDGRILVAGGEAYPGRVWSSAEIYDPLLNRWILTGSMNQARREFTLTLLPDGKVLAAGGSDEYGNVYVSAELYDPFTGSWTPTGSMNVARWGHAATLLADGRVLVAGGGNEFGAPTVAAEIYDPATGGWTRTADMRGARDLFTATLLADHSVIAAGGWNGHETTDTAEIFDPISETWSPIPRMRFPHDRHTATLLLNGRVLVVGGEGSTTQTLSFAEIYQPTT
jgi:hypothetical protein